MYIYVKGSDYFSIVSTYSLHLVMPFSHNQKLQCWGKKALRVYCHVHTSLCLSW